MKVLDVSSLEDMIEHLQSMLKKQVNQLKEIEASIKMLTGLDDELKGAGGEAIRWFYQECHLPFLNLFKATIIEYSSLLSRVLSAMAALEPSNSGHISGPFLDQNIRNGLMRIQQETSSLTDEANAVISSISGLVSVSRLQDDMVQNKKEAAVRHVDRTLDDLNRFDREKTSEMDRVSENISVMSVYLRKLQTMFTASHNRVDSFMKEMIYADPDFAFYSHVIQRKTDFGNHSIIRYPLTMAEIRESLSSDFTLEEEAQLKAYLNGQNGQITDQDVTAIADDEFSYESMRRVLGGPAAATTKPYVEGKALQAVADYLLFDDLRAIFGADSTWDERALAAVFLVGKPAKGLDSIYDGMKLMDQAKIDELSKSVKKVGGKSDGVSKSTGEALVNKRVTAGEKIIAQRVLKAELDLTPKLTPYKSLSRAQQKKIKEKIENRTVTKEEYKRYQWDNRFSKRRAAGVNEFWKQEKKRILDGEPPTRNWTNEQAQEILKGKKPQYNGQSIIGHHTYNAMNYPHISNRGELIYPVTSREHLKGWHGGSYSNNAPGRPVNPKYFEEFGGGGE